MAKINIQEAAGEDTQTEVRRGPSRDRDETQKQLDSLFKQLHTEWVTARHPEPREVAGKLTYSGPTRRLVVAKTDVSALKQMIRRAAALHGVATFFYGDHTRQDGNVTVKFGVTKKPVKAG